MAMIDLLPAAKMGIDEIAFRLSRGVRTGKLTGWEKGFALSVMRQAKRPDWQPSRRQRPVIDRLVEGLRRSHPDFDGEPDLIDDADGGLDG